MIKPLKNKRNPPTWFSPGALIKGSFKLILSHLFAVLSGSKRQLRRRSLRHGNGKEHQCGTAQWQDLHPGSAARHEHRRVEGGSEGRLRASTVP